MAQRVRYDKDLASRAGFEDHDLDLLPLWDENDSDAASRRSVNEEFEIENGCQIHREDLLPAARGFRLTMLPGKPWVCVNCLADLIRDGRIVPIPTQVYIDNVLGNIEDTNTELLGDGSVRAGGISFAWAG